MRDDDSGLREFLNEIRPRGKRGPRKPRKDGKPHTRRLSVKEQENRDLVARLVARKETSAILKVNCASHRKWVKKELKVALGNPYQPVQFWDYISTRDFHRLKVSRAKYTYISALTWAYAVFQDICSQDVGLVKMHCHYLAERLNVHLNGNFDLLRAVLRVCLDYDDQSKRSAQKNRSRDALAIRDWISRGITPDQVMKKHENREVGIYASSIGKRPAEVRQKQLQLQLAQAKDDADGAKSANANREMDECDRDDESPKEYFNWGDIKSVKSRTEHQIEKLSGYDHPRAKMIQYQVQNGMKPGQLRIALLAGADNPAGGELTGVIAVDDLIDVARAPDKLFRELQKCIPRLASKIRRPFSARRLTKTEARAKGINYRH